MRTVLPCGPLDVLAFVLSKYGGPLRSFVTCFFLSQDAARFGSWRRATASKAPASVSAPRRVAREGCSRPACGRSSQTWNAAATTYRVRRPVLKLG